MSSIFAMWAMMQGDIDPDPVPVCPYCGGELTAARPGWWAGCEKCDLEWRSRAALEDNARRLNERRRHKAAKR
jgi:tRNA(Ile2) C34 agmatinyltransferase TiaS